jgi:hypothetical protein
MNHGVAKYDSDDIKYTDGLHLSYGGGIPLIKSSSSDCLVDELKTKEESHIILYHHYRWTPMDDTGLLIVAHSGSKEHDPSEQLVLGLTAAEEDVLCSRFTLHHW